MDCVEMDGRYVPADEVHHVVTIRDNPELRLVDDNLMSLCKPHHSARTMLESVRHSL